MPHDAYKSATKWIKDLRLLILTIWAVAAISGSFFAFKFLTSSTVADISSTLDTPAKRASEQISNLFPNLAGSDVMITYFRAVDPNVILTEGRFADSLDKVYRQYKVRNSRGGGLSTTRTSLSGFYLVLCISQTLVWLECLWHEYQTMWSILVAYIDIRFCWNPLFYIFTLTDRTDV